MKRLTGSSSQSYLLRRRQEGENFTQMLGIVDNPIYETNEEARRKGLYNFSGIQMEGRRKIRSKNCH